jgi:hypothetical protein
MATPSGLSTRCFAINSMNSFINNPLILEL